ncbi:hypothetical protein [Novosphingobium terrae]|uniref:hypothetical protein n=1 Tax=Novosphingobium terrae TaxID=2726189 RepID=UPI00197D4E3A|nr:hypothetical protein [Novosphingobium terrae]
MKLDILPAGKAAATLFVESKQGVILPVFDDTFEGCAKVLRKMSPTEDGSTLWIECIGQKFDAAWVEAHLRSDTTGAPE